MTPIREAEALMSSHHEAVRDYCNELWQAVPDVELAGTWAVQPAGERHTRGGHGGVVLGSFISREIAIHVIELHNRDLCLR